MNRQRWIVLIVAVVLAGGGWWFFRGRSGTDAPKFRTAAVEQGAIESLVSATGTVRPVVQVEVGSQVSGTVSRLLVDYNARVREGQVLCQLDPSSFRARALQAEASVARAEAGVKDARRQLTRAKELIEQNYVSQAEVDAAEVTVETRDAELKQARAALEAAQVDLANTTIRAPIDGIVIARSVDLGQTVAASLQAPKLFVIANDLSQMQVETRIDEADIGTIHAGLPVRFTVDAFPDETFHGEVAQVRLEPITEQNVVTYTTVIRTGNPDLKLRPGMTANVSVQVARRDDVVKVANAALRFRPAASGNGARGGGAIAGPVRGGAPPATVGAAPGGERRGEAQASRAGREQGSDGAKPGDVKPGDARRSAGDAHAAGGAPGARMRGVEEGAIPSGLKPGTVYTLRAGKPEPVRVLTGLSDGAFTEIRSEELKPGDPVVVGLETSARGGQSLQPPPGMGGGFGGGGQRRGGGGR